MHEPDAGSVGQLKMTKPPRANTQREPQICYLCGGGLGSEKTLDHVPPSQIFPERLRKGLSLLKLPAHKQCNYDYQKDEEYFVVTLSPVAGDSSAGRALWEDLSHKFGKLRGRILGEMVRKEFYSVELPGQMKAKKFDGRRVRRVIAKIVRGLFFHEQGRFLPIETPCRVDVFGPHERPDDDMPEILGYAISAQSKGADPNIFDYRYRDHNYDDFPDLGALHLWFWAMFFWDAVTTLTVFHDPGCTCQICSPPLDCQG